MGDRHVVFVQDNNQILVNVPGLVQTFIGQPGGKGAVSDNGDNLSVVCLTDINRNQTVLYRISLVRLVEQPISGCVPHDNGFFAQGHTANKKHPANENIPLTYGPLSIRQSRSAVQDKTNAQGDERPVPNAYTVEAAVVVILALEKEAIETIAG